MEKITDRDIHIAKHSTDGFTLSYIADNNCYYKQRYIGYGLQEANRRFKEYVSGEIYKEEEIIQALRYPVDARLDRARELLARPL